MTDEEIGKTLINRLLNSKPVQLNKKGLEFWGIDDIDKKHKDLYIQEIGYCNEFELTVVNDGHLQLKCVKLSHLKAIK